MPALTFAFAQEKKLSLEALRAHKENAHKLRMDLEDAEKSHTDNLTTMNELEHEILQLQQKSDQLDGKLKKMTEIISSLRLLEAQHETLMAENTRRFDALPSEVEGPLAQLEEFQVRWPLLPLRFASDALHCRFCSANLPIPPRAKFRRSALQRRASVTRAFD